MKLRKEDIVRSQDASPLQLFGQGMRAEATRSWYTRKLRGIVCDILEDILEGDFEQRVEQFVRRSRDEPNWALDVMITLAWKLRERTELPKGHADYLNPTSVPGYFKPIKKLLEMNDVSIPWKRVHATFPEKDNMLDAKGWTRENIAAMLGQARDPMDRAVVLVLASSGVRLGGLNLRWGDLTPVYRAGDRLTADPGEGGEVVCAALSVYAGSPDSYTAFVTPEAYGAILEYGRMWADLVLRQPGPEDHVFLATKMAPRRASEQALAKRVRRMATKAGLREQDSKSGTRFDTQLIHGFRKFFNKVCRETLSGDSLASLIRAEYMMGHRGLVALDQNYFETDVLEMAAEYLNVVPDLTIDDAGRLKQSNRRMSDNIRKMEGEKDSKIARMREEMARMGRAKDEEMARMREEIAGLKRRRDFPVSGVLDALRESPGTDGVPAEVLKSLTGMMGQLGKFQEDAIREIRAEYDAKIEEMRREMGLTSGREKSGRGPPAGPGEEDTYDEDMRDPGPHHRDPF